MRTKKHRVNPQDNDDAQRALREANPLCRPVADSSRCGCGCATEQAWVASSVRRCIISGVLLTPKAGNR